MFKRIIPISILLLAILPMNVYSQNICSIHEIDSFALNYCHEYKLNFSDEEDLYSKKILYVRILDFKNDTTGIMICALYNLNSIDLNQIDYYREFNRTLIAYNFVNCHISEVFTAADIALLTKFSIKSKEHLKEHLLPDTIYAIGAINRNVLLKSKRSLKVTAILKLMETTYEGFEELDLNQ